MDLRISRCMKPTRGSLQNTRRMSTIKGHVTKRYHARKHYAKKHNVPFNISIDYVLSLVTTHCPILGIKMSWCVQSGKVTDASPSLDRIVPELGYVEGNVVWLSNRANRIKGDGTAAEHAAIERFMTQHHLIT